MKRDTKSKEAFLEIKKHKWHEQPKVSVIVPVYKVDRYLTQCLNSIVNQTMEELEIIIVDEGDQDRCREIIDFFETSDPRVVAPHQKNGGYGASCNLGIQMARGEFISIVESDDFLEPWTYEEMYAYAKKLGADVVKSPFRVVSQYMQRDYEFRDFQRKHLPKDLLFSAKQFNTILRFHGSIWSGLYKREYIEKNDIKFICERGGGYVDIVFRYDTVTKTDKIAWLDRLYYNYNVESEENSGKQHNNHNILAFLKRWQDIHKRLAQEPEDIRKSYYAALVYDEVEDTLAKMYFMEFSDEELTMLKENLDDLTCDVLDAAESLEGIQLSPQRRGLVESFKKDSRGCAKKLRRLRILKHIYMRVDSFLKWISDPILMLWAFSSLISTTVAIWILTDMFGCLHTTALFIVWSVCIIWFSLCVLGKFLKKIGAKIADKVQSKFQL